MSDLESSGENKLFASTSSSDHLFASSSSLDSVDSEEFRRMYRNILKDIPVEYVVSHLEDPSDRYSWKTKAGKNNLSEIYPDSEAHGIGMKITSIFEGKELEEILKIYESVIKSGVPLDLPRYELKVQDLWIPFRVKYTALSKRMMLVMFERLDQDKTDVKAKLNEILERSIDASLNNGLPDQDDAWMSTAVNNIINFVDDGDASIYQHNQERKKNVTAADIGTLIKGLSDGSQDEQFMNQFLTTFRYFTTPPMLMKKLILRYTSCTDQPDVQKRLVRVFKSWIANHFYDFKSDPALLKTLQTFSRRNFNLQDVKKMDRLIGKSLLQASHEDMDDSNQPPVLKSNSGGSSSSTEIGRLMFLEISPSLLAKQFTILCLQRLRMIRPFELYQQSWNNSKTQSCSPNVLEMIRHFNRISNWVASEIVLEMSVRRRSIILRYFISVAWAAFAHRDFETVFTVVLALSRQAISRLSLTWAQLDSQAKRQWEKLEELTSFKHNYKNYRRHIKTISLASGSSIINFMPYFGLYLKDLSFLEENSNFTKEGAVNFQKMRMIANIVSEIQRAQKSMFNFDKDVKILSGLMYDLPQVSEDNLFDYSLRCEGHSESTPERSRTFSDFFEVRNRSVMIETKNPLFGIRLPSKAPRSP